MHTLTPCKPYIVGQWVSSSLEDKVHVSCCYALLYHFIQILIKCDSDWFREISILLISESQLWWKYIIEHRIDEWVSIAIKLHIIQNKWE